MMETLVVKDFETAVDALIEKYVHPEFEDIDFSPDVNILIKVEGEQWDGAIDYKVAEFIIRLQKALLAVYNDHTEQSVRYNTRIMDDAGLRVTVSVEKGCTLFNINLKGWWDKMKSEHQLLAILGTASLVAVTVGAVFWHSDNKEKDMAVITARNALEIARIEAKKVVDLKVEERIQDEGRRKELSEMMNNCLHIAEQNSSYMYYLAAKMQDGDRLTVNDGKAISARDAKHLFKRSHAAEVEHLEFSYIIDDNYIVSAIDREKDTIFVRIGRRKYQFYLTSLEGNELERFYKFCGQHRKNSAGELPPIPLRLRAFFSGGAFKQGVVQGIGPKRKDAMSFADAALDSIERQEEMENTQNIEE